MEWRGSVLECGRCCLSITHIFLDSAITRRMRFTLDCGSRVGMGSTGVSPVAAGVPPEAVITLGKNRHLATAFPLAPREDVFGGTPKTTVETTVLPIRARVARQATPIKRYG